MKITEIIRAALFTPAGTREGKTTWGLTLCLWGDPGVGKTHRIQEEAARVSLPVEVLSPGERGEGAFGVVPVPGKSGFIEYPAPSWVRTVEPAGIVFLDEVNQAPPAIQPAIMGIALARRVGGYQLGHRTRVIAAANPPEKAAGGWDLAPPVANRMGHLSWDAPDAVGWSDYMIGFGGQADAPIAAEKLEEQVMRAWPAAFAEATGLVTAFVRGRGGILHAMPAVGEASCGRAWPSPRTWEMATRAIAAGQVHNLGPAEREAFVAAFIGDGAASELWAYREKVDLPSPADVLDGRVKWKPDVKRLDRTEAVLSACAALVVPPEAERRNERAAALWKLLGDKALGASAMDLTFAPAKALAKARPPLHVLPEALPVLQNMLPTLQAAGISVQG